MISVIGDHCNHCHTLLRNRVNSGHIRIICEWCIWNESFDYIRIYHGKNTRDLHLIYFGRVLSSETGEIKLINISCCRMFVALYYFITMTWLKHSTEILYHESHNLQIRSHIFPVFVPSLKLFCLMEIQMKFAIKSFRKQFIFPWSYGMDELLFKILKYLFLRQKASRRSKSCMGITSYGFFEFPITLWNMT